MCAFSNTAGGEILLGVNNKKEIVGVDPSRIDHYKKIFADTINNGSKINPPIYLVMEDILIDGKHILYILVPKSENVHRCNSRIYRRNHEGGYFIS